MKNRSQNSDFIGTFLTSEAGNPEKGIHQPGLFLRAALRWWSEQCGLGNAGLYFIQTLQAERNREWKLFLQIRGENVFKHPRGELRIQPGSMGVIPVRNEISEEWQVDSRGRYSHFFIGIYSGRLSSNFVNDQRIQTAISLPFAQSSLLERMIEFSATNQPAVVHHSRVIADILLDGMRVAGSDGPSRLIQKALHLILDHPCNPDLSVKWLAQQLECHADYLSRRFHLETGTLLMAYVRSKRMEVAADLLRSRKMSVADVALNCGYRDHSYFTRIFRQTYGVLPSQYS
jgi:AraC-like DNA-binding protein